MREVKPNQGPYAISKAALLQATRTLSTELGRDGIRVNMVLPGRIATSRVEALDRAGGAPGAAGPHAVHGP